MHGKESERLKYRDLTLDDYDHVAEMDSSSVVMKYITDGKTFTPEESKERINTIISKNEQLKPLGLWVIEDKESEEFLGYVMLKPLTGYDHPEVGYRLKESAWGRGVATEAAAAVIGYGFRELNLEKIMAIANPENTGSRRVLEKNNLRYLETITFFNPPLNKNVPAALYEINKSEFKF